MWTNPLEAKNKTDACLCGQILWKRRTKQVPVVRTNPLKRNEYKKKGNMETKHLGGLRRWRVGWNGIIVLLINVFREQDVNAMKYNHNSITLSNIFIENAVACS